MHQARDRAVPWSVRRRMLGRRVHGSCRAGASFSRGCRRWPAGRAAARDGATERGDGVRAGWGLSRQAPAARGTARAVRQTPLRGGESLFRLHRARSRGRGSRLSHSARSRSRGNRQAAFIQGPPHHEAARRRYLLAKGQAHRAGSDARDRRAVAALILVSTLSRRDAPDEASLLRNASINVEAFLALALVACGPRQPAVFDPGHHMITGGLFEASGVAHVPGSNQLLFVDDGRTREIFLMEISTSGNQNGPATRIPLEANVTDLEGITWDGRHFYVVGSQSKDTGFEGDGLVRFTFDPEGRRTDSVERIQGLKAWLAANVAELRGTERTIGDHILNIEGIAWDPVNDRLLLGLRAPVVDGLALIVPIKLIDSAEAFSIENLRVDGPTIRLDLQGEGVRSIEYDDRAKAFRIFTGATLNEEDREFRLVEWDGKSGSAPRELSRFSRLLKPEGIARADLDGQSISVIVFDTGGFTVLD